MGRNWRTSPREKVVAVGEVRRSAVLKTPAGFTRVTVHHTLGRFRGVLKAPGKGRRSAEGSAIRNDKVQMGEKKKLRSLPNILYSDGNAFSLWQNGGAGRWPVVTLHRRTSSPLAISCKRRPACGRLFEKFLTWEPIPAAQRAKKDLAHQSGGAPLPGFLRDEGDRPTRPLGKRGKLTALRDGTGENCSSPTAHQRALCGWLRARPSRFGLLMARAEKKFAPRQGPSSSRHGNWRKSNSLIGAARSACLYR